MLTSTSCPEVSAYRQLTAGQLPVEQAESLLQHLEACDACVAKIRTLPASDTLIEWIRQGKSSPSSEEKPLTPLMQRLIQLGKSAASSSGVSGTTLTFSCGSCRKPMRVQQEAAGKKVKCPHCKQVVLAPAATPAAPPEAMETAVLPPVATSQTATLANLPASSKEQELCAFLAPSQAPDEIGRLGAYRVLKVLGAGGMGVVFRAEDPQLQRLVALKAMLPALAANDSARQRFLREARAASLKHDHIVTIFQVGEDRGAPFLAMEFLEGEALEDRLKREGKLPLAEVLRIGHEIAEGLQAAHEHGLIHRDIKPANVWLEGKRGRAKILDFGLARSSADEVHLTQSGAIVGTPAYMPPEQARGDKVDGRCDLYSLGCVLFRLCTGELPFKADNTMSLLLALATEQPKSPREINADVPPSLADLILRLLAKDPAQRPATAGDVAEALDAIHAGQPTGAPAHAPAPPRRRRRLLVATAAGALLLAGILAIIVIVRNKQGEEIARLKVPEGGSVEMKDKDGRQTPPKRQDGRDERGAAKIPPPVQIPEPPPLAEWLEGRKSLTVSQDGKGQFKTIQAALEALKPHQVVKVLDRGPYMESLKVDALPADTGLISEQQSVLQIPSWPNGTHSLGPLDGFRLSGFRLLSPPGIGRWDTMIWWNEPSGLVMENCYFGWTKPWDGSIVKLFFNRIDPNGQSVIVRNCFFDSGIVDFNDLTGSAPTVLLQQNYFKNAYFSPGVGRLQKILIRHNVFDSPSAIWIEKVKEVREVVEISNNTLVGKRDNTILGLRFSVPKRGIIARNNISDTGIGLWDEALQAGTEAFQNKRWQIDHNCYLRRGALPKAPGDVVDEPRFLSLDPSQPDYLRIAADGPAAKGGAGAAWPSYIGALPPGPAPKEGDWFTRLRQRWGNLAPSEKPPLDPAWIKQVAALPPFKQVEAVYAKLQERNPGFSVKALTPITWEKMYAWLQEKEGAWQEGSRDDVGRELRFTIEKDAITRVVFSADNIEDLSPLLALKGLKSLGCLGSPPKGGKLADLSPLKDLPLLTHLWCGHTKVSSLSPLKELRLTYLYCGDTLVSDLSPLKGMPLTHLDFRGAHVSDLSPLKGMLLTYLKCIATEVSDLSPLKGMPLEHLDCRWTKVSDLTPLKGMPLTKLECQDAKVSDLSVLKDLSLKGLWCDFKPERDSAILRSIKTLETINDKPAAEFWKEVDAKAANKKP
ncbi:MAG TPA: protein kinase [Gemmataceae bacterium]|nr:protein kinase [Gemmataceae bacterium]